MSLKRTRSNPVVTDDVDLTVDVEGNDDLPDVDDLEVAAAAAAGVLEPAWVVQRMLGEVPAAPPAVEPAPPPTPQPYRATGCSVQLHVVGDSLSVQLIPTHHVTVPDSPHAPMVSDDGDSSDTDTSSSSDSDDQGMTEADYVSSKAEVMAMMAAAAEDHDGAGSKVNVATELQLRITIPDEPLHPAGTLTSVVEGCLVVQGCPGATPLDVGSALCTADRMPLGYVEDVFGPVNAPLYVLQYAGAAELPDSLQPGVEVFAVPSMMQLVEQATLDGALQGGLSDVEVDGEESDEEQQEEKQAPPVKAPAMAKRSKRGGRGRGGRGQQPAVMGGAAFNAESLLAGYQFQWQPVQQPVQQPYAAPAWQGVGGPPPAQWAPAPPNSLPPNYYRPQ